jgi:hypothetical protein
MAQRDVRGLGGLAVLLAPGDMRLWAVRRLEVAAHKVTQLIFEPEDAGPIGALVADAQRTRSVAVANIAKAVVEETTP